MAAKTGLLGVAAAQTDKYKKRVGVMAGLGIGTSITDRNTTITIKSSPPKTARNCSHLGVRSGFVTKRNEQNSWQRRFCVMVPHTFLYYFEDEDSDTPRGIIDMEYYTQMTPLQGDSEHEHVLQIHSDDETDSMRAFVFKFDSDEDLNGWMSSMHRDRFHAVREQRDQYQELQMDFQNQSMEVAEMVGELTQGRERAESKLQVSAANNEKVMTQLRTLLTLTGGDTAVDMDLHADTVGGEVSVLLERFADIIQRITLEKEEVEAEKSRLEQQVSLSAQTMVQSSAEAEEVKQETAQLREQLGRATASQDEQTARLESMAEQVRVLEQELQQYRTNLNIAASARRSAEAKATELSEQKKLLVREVKTARKQLKLSNAEKEALQERLNAAGDLGPATMVRSDSSMSIGSANGLPEHDSSNNLNGMAGDGGDEAGDATRSPAGSVDQLKIPVRDLENGSFNNGSFNSADWPTAARIASDLSNGEADDGGSPSASSHGLGLGSLGRGLGLGLGTGSGSGGMGYSPSGGAASTNDDGEYESGIEDGASPGGGFGRFGSRSKSVIGSMSSAIRGLSLAPTRPVLLGWSPHLPPTPALRKSDACTMMLTWDGSMTPPPATFTSNKNNPVTPIDPAIEVRFEVQYKTQFAIRWQSSTNAVQFDDAPATPSAESGAPGDAVAEASVAGSSDAGSAAAEDAAAGAGGSGGDASEGGGEVTEKADGEEKNEEVEKDASGKGEDEGGGKGEDEGEEAEPTKKEKEEAEAGAGAAAAAETPEAAASIEAPGAPADATAPGTPVGAPAAVAQRYSMVLTNLKPEECYTVRLRAVLPCGYSDWSELNDSCWTTKAEPTAPPTTVMANGLDCAAPDYPYRSPLPVAADDASGRSRSATSAPSSGSKAVEADGHRRASTGSTSSTEDSPSLAGAKGSIPRVPSLDFDQPAPHSKANKPKPFAATYTSLANAGKLTKEKVQGLKQESSGWWSKGQGLVDGLNLFPNVGKGAGAEAGLTSGEVIEPGLSRSNSRSNSIDSEAMSDLEALSMDERNSGVGDAVADRAEVAAYAAQEHADAVTAALAAELGRSAGAVRKSSKTGWSDAAAAAVAVGVAEGGDGDAGESEDGEDDQVEL